MIRLPPELPEVAALHNKHCSLVPQQKENCTGTRLLQCCRTEGLCLEFLGKGAGNTIEAAWPAVAAYMVREAEDELEKALPSASPRNMWPYPRTAASTFSSMPTPATQPRPNLTPSRRTSGLTTLGLAGGWLDNPGWVPALRPYRS